MAIENRELAVGTKLAATYKKQRYECDVVETPEGLRYRLMDFAKQEGGGYRYAVGETADFTTPSGAAHAVMQGMAVNGWRFWSLAEELDKPKAPRATTAPTTARVPRPRKGKAGGEPTAGEAAQRNVQVITKMESQEGMAAGRVKYWCTACADAFDVPASVTPQGCPKGHAAEAPNCELQSVEPVERVADPFEGQEPAPTE